MRSLKFTATLMVLTLAGLLPAPAPEAFAQCQRAKLTAGDGATEDRFGFSVAISEDTVLVGAPYDDDRGDNYGSAYVFERSVQGPGWWQVDNLPPVGSSIPSNIGRSVAIDGDITVLGLHGGQSAYVFERSGGVWSETAELVADDHWFGDFYGESVAVSGDFAVVSAPYDNDNGGSSGSAYVFERDPNGVWSQAAKLLADDGQGGDLFGHSVAIDGDVIAIGARDDDDLGNWSGSAYVFERDPNGVWSQVAKLLPGDGTVFWLFGDSVAVSGNRVLVGATGAQVVAPSGGAAYVFERDPNGDWPEVAQIVSDDNQNSDFFGIAVALDGDIALVGAENADYRDTDSGAAYVFVRQPDGSWPQAGKIGAFDGAYDDRFGSAVGVSGNRALIGAFCDDDQGENSGSAYIFAVGPDEDGDGVMDICQPGGYRKECISAGWLPRPRPPIRR